MLSSRALTVFPVPMSERILALEFVDILAFSGLECRRSWFATLARNSSEDGFVGGAAGGLCGWWWGVGGGCVGLGVVGRGVGGGGGGGCGGVGGVGGGGLG